MLSLPNLKGKPGVKQSILKLKTPNLKVKTATRISVFGGRWPLIVIAMSEATKQSIGQKENRARVMKSFPPAADPSFGGRCPHRMTVFLACENQ